VSVVAGVALVALLGLVALVALASGSAPRAEGRAPTAVVGALAGGLLLVVVAVALVGGVDIGRSSSRGSPPEGPEVSTPSGGVPIQPETVRLVAAAADDLPPVTDAVGNLTDGSTLVLGVIGLDPGSRATVHQCPAGARQPAMCRAGLPFRMSEQRRASVLVDLVDVFEVTGAGRVDCTSAPCSLVVFGSSRLEVQTTFDGPAPPPVVLRLAPPELAPGDKVSATARGLPPGARVAFVVCRAGGGATADCSAPTSEVVVGPSGRATGTVVVSPGRCSRGETCAVAVTAESSGPLALTRLRLIGRAGAGYDEARLRAGLVAAGLLIAGALLLLRRTDWTPVEGDPFAGVTLPEDPFADDPPR
jgi:hypothetical protein